MSRVLIPASSAEEWKRFLAEPDKHWRRGYSARALAYCWQQADGIPPDVISVLSKADRLQRIQAIFVIPEHQVPLPGGVRPSQNDAWVLAQTPLGLVSMAVEGKVSEPFGPTVGEWDSESSQGKGKRLRYLCDELGLSFPPPPDARYQLFHRTASAVIEAKRFRAEDAVMLVHSFSPDNEWLDDYRHFTSLFGLQGGVDQTVSAILPSGLNLHLAWVHGAEKYLDL